MAKYDPMIHICDDWIDIKLPNWETILAAQTAFSADNRWTEIVPGLDSIAVQFDPALISPRDAANLASDQLNIDASATENTYSVVTIPICYEAEHAPDRDYVAEKLGIEAEALPSWHASQRPRVAMLGFMPGFAYLENNAECPAIGRLNSPRQLIPAGSIGIIGTQSCIYSFDSPGGWPIIGRTPLRLFDPSRKESTLLSTGQSVRFESISKAAFDNWPTEAKR
ncbi:carboxyltransferase domain-containing protein [Parasphingorhabdus sp.]|uniref:5-oxoprolinase subunit B family protein n=1 Tax=Parasphingorhabdus sp. TaxID=2709688 RepID=UPI00326376A1